MNVRKKFVNNKYLFSVIGLILSCLCFLGMISHWISIQFGGMANFNYILGKIWYLVLPILNLMESISPGGSTENFYFVLFLIVAILPIVLGLLIDFLRCKRKKNIFSKKVVLLLAGAVSLFVVFSAYLRLDTYTFYLGMVDEDYTGYEKRLFSVYWNAEEISEADRDSFEIIDYEWARDKDNSYQYGEISVVSPKYIEDLIEIRKSEIGALQECIQRGGNIHFESGGAYQSCLLISIGRFENTGVIFQEQMDSQDWKIRCYDQNGNTGIDLISAMGQARKEGCAAADHLGSARCNESEGRWEIYAEIENDGQEIKKTCYVDLFSGSSYLE